jgi:hypothetical protein
MFLSSSALAASSTATYTVNGKDVSASEALKQAIDGNEVMQCQKVVLTPNKSGTSFSLKKPKKVKSED